MGGLYASSHYHRRGPVGLSAAICLAKNKYRQFPCRIVTISEQGDYLEKDHDFLEKYGISKRGAVLVRPDGHIAWYANDEKEDMVRFSWLI